MSIEEQRRERFEQAYREKFGRLPQNWNEALGKYFDAHGQGAWWAWNAALDSAVIELPEKYADSMVEMHGHCARYNDAIRECREAIEAAGLKVKP